MKYFLLLLPVITLTAFPEKALTQQVPDTSFTHHIHQPEYPDGKGPVIVLDEAHSNFHTLGERYLAFGKLLEADGYRVQAGTQKFTKEYLQQVNILVVANALSDSAANWNLPVLPAFTDEEVEAVKEYVYNGGSLFLIADHMPFAGAAEKLAAAFGFNLVNGYALRADKQAEVFSLKNKHLLDHDIVSGRDKAEKVDSITLFTGSAFIAPPGAKVITVLLSDYKIFVPSVSWEINANTPSLNGTYFANGASLQFGRGRLVVFGEAAAFTAQLAGPSKQPVGMNHPHAIQNPQLLLNIIHWLDLKF